LFRVKIKNEFNIEPFWLVHFAKAL
jgi:hypothetical protein